MMRRLGLEYASLPSQIDLKKSLLSRKYTPREPGGQIEQISCTLVVRGVLTE